MKIIKIFVVAVVVCLGTCLNVGAMEREIKDSVEEKQEVAVHQQTRQEDNIQTESTLLLSIGRIITVNILETNFIEVV